MKRFILWAIMLTIFIPMSFAEATISYVGCYPTSGSSVSSFDFTLEFNYDGVIEENGEGEYGIGWIGDYFEGMPDWTMAVELYEGDRTSGKFLDRILTTSADGKSDSFKVGNTVTLSFPGIIPENGKNIQCTYPISF
ncbi:MAG: hypothetical protein J6C81_05290 [Muribaculaceae bacterium]|nr:hypothetical protein [Muribaculaceae bacterium]